MNKKITRFEKDVIINIKRSCQRNEVVEVTVCNIVTQ